MDISIVIVNYNVKEYIISCIESIYKHSKARLSFEVIVVDNNSKDGSTKKIEDLFPKVTVLKNNKNFGFSFAANQGAELSSGNYILILNPDTLFNDDVLKKLYNEAKNQQNLGVLGPSLVSENGSVHQSFWRDPNIFTTILSIFHLDFLNIYKNYNNVTFEKSKTVDTISGGAFFLKKDLFVKLGGFNDALFWMEDIDFCKRVRQKNYNVIYFSKAKIIHFIGKSSEKNLKVSISNQLISKIKFYKIHGGKLSVSFILIAVIIISTLKSIIFLLLFPFSQNFKRKFLAYKYTLVKVLINFKSYY